MNMLTVQFNGICTHVKELPGPIAPPLHRVVLVHGEDGAFINGNSIPPHVPLLKIDPAAIVGTEGYLYGLEETDQAGVWRLCGVQLELDGVTDTSLHVDLAYDTEVPRLRKLTPDSPVLSEEVVTGEQAACYFDVPFGCLNATKIELGAVAAVLTADTTETPGLRVFCFWNRETSIIRLKPGTTIYVEHTGVKLGDSEWDFLLHYRVLKSVPEDAKVPDEKKPSRSSAFDLTSGCSNSAYP